MNLEQSFFSEEKTIYTIEHQDGEKSTITLSKFVADVLQANLENVHVWIRQAYDKVSDQWPDLSRRKKGDFVRDMAREEAAKTDTYKEFYKRLPTLL